jgi:hypothetical protein
MVCIPGQGVGLPNSDPFAGRAPASSITELMPKPKPATRLLGYYPINITSSAVVFGMVAAG